MHYEKNAGALTWLGGALVRGALQTAEKAVRYGVPAVTKTFKALNAPSSWASGAAKRVNPLHTKGPFMSKLKAAPLHGFSDAASPLTLGFGAMTGLSAASQPNRFER